MKVTAIRYGMLRVTRQFENDRVEVEVAVEGKGSQAEIDAATAEAKHQCRRALGIGGASKAEVKEWVQTVKDGLDKIVAGGRDPKPF